MEMVLKEYVRRSAVFLILAGMLFYTSSGFCQEQAYEYGHIVTKDENTEALDFLDVNEEEGAKEEKLPWNPLLSPWMICLDCWITRAIEIKDHYGQQAAERYFKQAETCTDIYLGYDPKGTGLKYCLLAPFYAGCPSILEHGGFWGWVRMKCGGLRGAGGGPGGNYGFASPMPALGTQGPNGPTLMAPPSQSPETSGQPAMTPPEQAAPPLMPKPEEAGSGSASVPRRIQTADAGKYPSKWSQMSDEQILSYFGLNPAQVATNPELGSQLESPVEPVSDWEYAEEAPSKPAGLLIATGNAVPQSPTDQPESRQEPETTTSIPTSTVSVPGPDVDIERLRRIVRSQEEEKPFSVTDPEYDRLREIGESLLDTSR